MKFKFNKSARAATIKALEKLANRVVPIMTLFGVVVLKFDEAIVVAFSSLVSFVICQIAIIFVAGLEDKVTRKTFKKSKYINRSGNAKTDDTS